MKIVCRIDFDIQAVSPKPKYINIITSLTLITFSRETGVLKTSFDMNFLCLNSRSVSKESFTRMRKENCFPLSINLFFGGSVLWLRGAVLPLINDMIKKCILLHQNKAKFEYFPIDQRSL